MYSSDGAAGADIFADIEAPIEIKAGETAMIRCGISIELPDGYVGLLYARSGLASRDGLAPANKVGVIDSDYRGEIMTALHNHGKSDKTVEPGQRIAQLVIMPVQQARFSAVDELSSTTRGSAGFGSTGK